MSDSLAIKILKRGELLAANIKWKLKIYKYDLIAIFIINYVYGWRLTPVQVYEVHPRDGKKLNTLGLLITEKGRGLFQGRHIDCRSGNTINILDFLCHRRYLLAILDLCVFNFGSHGHLLHRKSCVMKVFVPGQAPWWKRPYPTFRPEVEKIKNKKDWAFAWLDCAIYKNPFTLCILYWVNMKSRIQGDPERETSSFIREGLWVGARVLLAIKISSCRFFRKDIKSSCFTSIIFTYLPLWFWTALIDPFTELVALCLLKLVDILFF